MPPDNLDAIAQGKSLIGIVRDSGVERCVTNGNTGGCGNDPPDVLILPIPQFNAERQVGRDVVQVRVGQLAK